MDQNGNVFDVSLRNQLLTEIKNVLINNFDSYLDKSCIEYKTVFDIGSLENNFNTSILDIKINLPLLHFNLCDYFCENYIISNNGKDNYLLSTKNKSFFITDEYIVLNFSYLANLRNDGYIISNHYKIDMSSIPEKYKRKNKMRIIDIDGNSQDTLLKIVGYK